MELPVRKKNRLEAFDYSAPYAYFVTLCTQDRKNLFWGNVGAVIGRPEDVRLNELGVIVRWSIEEIPKHYPMISVDNFTIMPDHVHLLLQIHADANGRPMAAPTLSTVVNQMKGIVSKQAGFSVWQKGFYDHVVRGEKDYLEIWDYIEGNPSRWAENRTGDPSQLR